MREFLPFGVGFQEVGLPVFVCCRLAASSSSLWHGNHFCKVYLRPKKPTFLRNYINKHNMEAVKSRVFSATGMTNENPELSPEGLESFSSAVRNLYRGCNPYTIGFMVYGLGPIPQPPSLRCKHWGDGRPEITSCVQLRASIGWRLAEVVLLFWCCLIWLTSSVVFVAGLMQHGPSHAPKGTEL